MPHQLLFQFITVTLGSVLFAWLGTKFSQYCEGAAFRMAFTVLGVIAVLGANDNALVAFGILMVWTLVCASLAHDFNEINIAEGGYEKRNRTVFIRLAVVLLGFPALAQGFKWGTWLLTLVFYGHPTVIDLKISGSVLVWLLFLAWSFFLTQMVSLFTAQEVPFSVWHGRCPQGRPPYEEDDEETLLP